MAHTSLARIGLEQDHPPALSAVNASPLRVCARARVRVMRFLVVFLSQALHNISDRLFIATWVFALSCALSLSLSLSFFFSLSLSLSLAHAHAHARSHSVQHVTVKVPPRTGPQLALHPTCSPPQDPAAVAAGYSTRVTCPSRYGASRRRTGASLLARSRWCDASPRVLAGQVPLSGLRSISVRPYISHDNTPLL